MKEKERTCRPRKKKREGQMPSKLSASLTRSPGAGGRRNRREGRRSGKTLQKKKRIDIFSIHVMEKKKREKP